MAWIYKRGDSKYLWVGWRTPDGKIRSKSTKTADRAEAKKQLAGVCALFETHKAGSLSQEVYESLTGRTSPKMTVKAALADWLTECEGSTSQGTLERYTTIAAAFAAHIGATDKGPLLDDVTPEHIREFLNSRRAIRNASTVNLERKILAVFFLRGVKNSHLKASPVAPVRLLKQSRGEKGRRRAFTVSELKTISAKCPDDFWRYLVLAGFYTGQRMGDLICLTWGAVDFDDDVIRLWHIKTETSVQVPMRPTLRSMLAALRPSAGKVKPSDFIWPEHAERYQRGGAGPFSNQFYEILTSCGLVPARSHKTKKAEAGPRKVTPISFHSLRHTFVTLLKATGGSQAVAKELAGHSSDAVSDLYTHTDTATLAKAIAALPEMS